jgi:hypothetical protein
MARSLSAGHGRTNSGERSRPARPSVRNASRNAVATFATAESAFFRLLTQAVLAAASLISALIGLAIVLRLLGANSRNGIVHAIHTAANFFAGSFTTLFTIHHARLEILVNWGIALCVFLLAGLLLAAAIGAISRALVPRTAADK